ncbi:MAG: hypothetical protein AB1485_02275, partial [Candidatus Thermoplasmatota archaeon]
MSELELEILKRITPNEQERNEVANVVNELLKRTTKEI